MPEYNLKLATVNDLPELLPIIQMAHNELLYKLKFSGERVLAVLSDVLKQGVIICLVATVQDRPVIVGVFIALKTLTPTSLQPVATELLWYVHPEHRKTRKSLELLEAFEYWARKEKVSAMILGNMQNASSTGTHKLYLRKGYQLSEQSYFKKVD